MERITKGHPLSQSHDLVKENIEILKELFPTIVKENQIDWDELRAVLGEEIISEEEYYKFTWAGKSQAKIEANKLSTGTLRPCKEESKNWETTQNLFFEGDNLEVLKLLVKSYAGRIKMMYFDPPYNTGNDFVYKDDYSDNLSNYLKKTNQADEAGSKFRANSESEGRFHSNWLNMLYPRLELARKLLDEKGVIFISIDDNEFANLRKLCNEVFGEENFIGSLVWKSRQNKDNRNITGLSIDHEYIICYAKTIFGRALKGTERKIEQYSNPDNDERGPWVSANMVGLLPEDQRPNCHYDLINPETGINYGKPKMGWRYDQNTMKRLIAEERIIWSDTPEGRPRRKVFLSEVSENLPNFTSIFGQGVYTRDGTSEIDEIFGNKFFDFPKPTKLISEIIQQATSSRDSDIVLDIFSGSGTTAHAIMKQNSEDSGNRRFILVQIPEPIEPNSLPFQLGLKTIADIGKERIRRSGEKILSDKKTRLNTLKESIKGKMLQEETEAEIKELENTIGNLDTGFRVFKLDTSNILAWDGSVENLEENLLSAVENIKRERDEEDVLFEILLKYGIDLAQPIEKKVIAGCKVFSIGAGVLFVCLSDKITTAVADGIGTWKNELNPAVSKVVFKDSGFAGDVDKTNTIQILKRFGITDVKSI